MGPVRLTGVGVLFLASLAVGGWLHLDVALVRRLASRVVRHVMARQITGKLRVPVVQSLSANGARLKDIVVLAKRDGKELLRLRDVVVQFPPPLEALTTWLRRRQLSLPSIEVADAFVSLRHSKGQLDIATALRARRGRPRTRKSVKAASSVRIAHIGVRRTVVATDGRTTPTFRATIADLKGTIERRGRRLDLAIHEGMIDAKRTPLGPLALSVTGHVRHRVKRGEGRLWLSADGTWARQGVTLRLVHESGRAIAEVRFPDIGPEAYTTWLGEVDGPIDFPRPKSIDIRLQADPKRGTFTAEARLRAGTEKSHVTARASGGLYPVPWIEGTANGQAIALRHARGKLVLPQVKGRFRGVGGPRSQVLLQLSAHDPSFAGLPLGRRLTVRVRGSVRQLGVTIDGSAPGWSLEGQAQRAGITRRTESVADVWQTSLRLRTDRLRDLPWPAQVVARLPIAHGVQVQMSGRVGRGDLALATTVTANRATWRRTRTGFTRLDMRLGGTIDSPRVDATLVGRRVSGMGMTLHRVRLSALGTPKALALIAHAEDGDRRQIALSSRWKEHQRALRDLRLRWGRGSAELGGQVASVRMNGGYLDVQGIAVDGPRGGKIAGDLRFGRGEPEGNLSVVDLDLRPVSRLLGLEYPLEGKLGGSFAMQGRGSARRGHAEIHLTEGGLLLVSGIGGWVRLDLQGRKWTAEGKLSMGFAAGRTRGCREGLVNVTAAGSGRVGTGGLLQAPTWRGYRGQAAAQAQIPQLSCLRDIIDTLDPSGDVVVSELGGRATLNLGLHRSVGAPPRPEVRLTTTELRATVTSDEDVELWKSGQLDIRLDAKTAQSGDGSIQLKLLPHRPDASPHMVLRSATAGPWWTAKERTGLDLRGEATSHPGTLTIHGRTFVIEQAHIHVPAGPSWRPHLRIRASYRHGDDVTIYARYDGPVGSGSRSALRWRAVPARTTAQILKMLRPSGDDDSPRAD